MDTETIKRHIDKATSHAQEHCTDTAQAWATIAQAEAMLALLERLDAIMRNRLPVETHP